MPIHRRDAEDAEEYGRKLNHGYLG